jgi:hypothetical protein
LGDDLRVEGRTALGDAADGGDENGPMTFGVVVESYEGQPDEIGGSR